MGHTRIDKFSAAGLLISLGIIYGDIGTSPLYVMNAIMGDAPVSKTLIFGGISAVFWTLTIQTTLKYVIMVLQADNKGEGGIFSLYSLLRRRFPYLVIGTMIGGAMMFADSIITPPISVSSAIEGLRSINPSNGYSVDFSGIETVPIVITIIIILFLFQRAGTNAVGRFFGPVMTVWFTMLGALGIIQIIKHPEIFQAINPIWVYRFLTSGPDAFILLSAVFLCTTGAEALYSDMGHCGKQNIRISWIFVKVTLLLNYFGQGAWLMDRIGTSLEGSRTFYGIMPEWFLPFGISIATLAAIIASQAVISGSYTLASEAIRLHFLPKFTVKFPSTVKGQIYIPAVNTALLLGCIAIVLIFQESVAMEAAYGLSISLAFVMTSILMYYYLQTKGWHPILSGIVMTFFLLVDLAFVSANMTKLMEGGFVVVIIGLIVIAFMYISYRSGQIKKEMVVTEKLSDYRARLRSLSQDTTLPKFATHLIYMSKAPADDEAESPIFYSILQKRPKRADFYWFVNIEVTDEPYTMEYRVCVVEKNDLYKVRFRLGFRVQPKISLYLKKVIADMLQNKEIDLDPHYHGFSAQNQIGDFRFVLVEEEISAENESSFFDMLILDGYEHLKNLAGTPEKWFGIDESVVTKEMVPIVLKAPADVNLKRIR
ncbi:MAG: KUP/HAK/KT family potassium transporter [Bacteroidia bacterium]|nr:KUP/HAK/KT family potassium transporter [Bacteroidia bacterium]